LYKPEELIKDAVISPQMPARKSKKKKRKRKKKP